MSCYVVVFVSEFRLISFALAFIFNRFILKKKKNHGIIFAVYNVVIVYYGILLNSNYCKKRFVRVDSSIVK